MFKTAASAVGLHAPTDFRFLILDFRLESENKFNSLANRKSQIKNRKSIWWTERDSSLYEKFAAASMLSVTSSARKSGVEDGIFTRTSHVLTKLCASPSMPIRLKIGTDGEI